MGSEPCVEDIFSASLLLISCVTSNLDSSKNYFRVVHVHYPYAPTLTTVLSNHFCLSLFQRGARRESLVNSEKNHTLNLKVIDAEDNRGSPNKVSKLILQDKTKSCDDNSQISSNLENSC